ncbi:MAG: hypothetical protein KJO79_09715 [Verrucomicrobiae bacterium]|nr:hypothetical protein [Verrucomicrobiae bacterium]NNJ87447.1 hypothetical protein [Akkermansiaceae bacterium]
MDQRNRSFSLLVTDAASAGFADYTEGRHLDLKTVACLRHLPGRRAVWKARCEGHDVLLKVFDQHPKQRRDLDREWDNARALFKAGLATPEPLFKARDDSGLLAVAFTYIENGRTLKEVFAEADEATLAAGLRQLLELHAKQHAAGSYQKDNHLGNYFSSRGDLYMLDAGSCVLKDNALSIHDRVQNMAMLIANIPLHSRKVFDGVFSTYLDCCPDEIDRQIFLGKLAIEVPEARNRRLMSYLRKTRRSSSKLERSDHPDKSWHACRQLEPGLKSKLLENPEQFFIGQTRKGARVEDGEGYLQTDFEQAGHSYVLRRYDRPSLVNRLRQFFSISVFPRVLEVWSNGHALNMVGLESPRPLACLVLKKYGFYLGGYLLLEKTNGKRLSERDDVSEDIVLQFDTLIQDFKSLRITHRGLMPSDMSIDENGRLVLVDTASLRFHKSVSEYQKEAAEQAQTLEELLG